jgi:hypothetical protein
MVGRWCYRAGGAAHQKEKETWRPAGAGARPATSKPNDVMRRIIGNRPPSVKKMFRGDPAE